MYAEFEQKIRSLVQERCASIADESIREFIGSCAKDVHGVKTSDMAGLLNRFGSAYKETFQQKTKDYQRAETFYKNIVTNRHQTAHSRGGNTTVQEVKRFYEEGHIVLDFFREALLPTYSSPDT